MTMFPSTLGLVSWTSIWSLYLSLALCLDQQRDAWPCDTKLPNLQTMLMSIEVQSLGPEHTFFSIRFSFPCSSFLKSSALSSGIFFIKSKSLRFLHFLSYRPPTTLWSPHRTHRVPTHSGCSADNRIHSRSWISLKNHLSDNLGRPTALYVYNLW